MSLYSILSALAAATAGVSILALAAAVRVGARSEESLGVPVAQESLRRDGRNGQY